MDTTTSNPAHEAELRAENAGLRARLEKAEATLRAIRSGERAELVVETNAGPQNFSIRLGRASDVRRFRP